MSTSANRDFKTQEQRPLLLSAGSSGIGRPRSSYNYKRSSSTNHSAVRSPTDPLATSAMATARSLARKLLRLDGNASTNLLSAMSVGAGFLSAAAVALAASDEGVACPAYPWPQDGQQGGRQVFMQSDCAACHSMLPYAGLREAAPGEAEPKVAEIIVVNEEQPMVAGPLQSGTYTPVATKMLEVVRRNNLYTAEELKKKMVLPTPVWLQFLQPYMRPPQTA